MTGRQELERRIAVMRVTVLVGVGLYFVPMLGVIFSPWLAVVAALGAMTCIAGVLMAVASLRCPACHGNLGSLLMLRKEGRLFALPEGLLACPRCGFDLDAHGSHEGLIEFLSGHEGDGAYLAVVSVPVGDRHRQCELALCGDSRRTFASVFQLRPFDKGIAGDYRYFFVPSRQGAGAGVARDSIAIRAEKGDEQKTVVLAAPAALITILEWLRQPDAVEQVLGVRQVETPQAN